ncbi:MAG: hypothetical protein ACYCXI_06785 [Dethiobacteraceae bacterium]
MLCRAITPATVQRLCLAVRHAGRHGSGGLAGQCHRVTATTGWEADSRSGRQGGDVFVG